MSQENSSPPSETSIPAPFRTARADIPVSTPDGSSLSPDPSLVRHEADVLPSFLEHKAMSIVPYVADVYGLSGIYQSLSSADMDNIDMVETYLDSKIRGGEYMDTPESARAILENLEKAFGISKHQSPYYRIERIAEAIGVLSDQRTSSLTRRR